MTVLEEANNIVHGARRESYGHPRDNFRRTAKVWSGILDTEITPEQVALCMVGIKLAREAFKHTRDNLVDLAGYTAVLDILATDNARE